MTELPTENKPEEQPNTQSYQPRKISTACPRCDSNDTQSFQMAYQTGTSTGNLSVATYNPHTGFGVGGGKTSNQTILAGQLKPPAASNSGCANTIVFGLLFVIVFIFSWTISASIAVRLGALFFSDSSGAVSVLMSLFFAIPAFALAVYCYSFLQKGAVENEKKSLIEYQKAVAEWSKSWICLRCGNNWLMETNH